MDISLLIMTNPGKTQSKYRIGDIISVGPASREDCGHNRFMLITIIGLPEKDSASWHLPQRDGQRFGSPQRDGASRRSLQKAPAGILLTRFKQMLEAPEFVIEGNPPKAVVRRKRAWRFNIEKMPPHLKKRLYKNRKMTISWADAKKYLAKRFVVTDNDPQKDTETAITDRDV